MYGGDGNDSIRVYGDKSTVSGGEGNDHIFFRASGKVEGDEGADDIWLGNEGEGAASYKFDACGGDGNDMFHLQVRVALWGHTATLTGGDGNDVYFNMGNPKHSVIVKEGQDGGIDQIDVLLGVDYTLGANVENLSVDDKVFGSTTVINDFETPSGGSLLIGNSLNNHIFGSVRDDELRGAAGNDSLSGAKGNDIIQGGIGNDSLRGDSGTDTLYGEDGNDFLIYEKGDKLYGGDGDDTYQVGSNADLIIEEYDRGEDTVQSLSQHYTLGIYFEDLELINKGMNQSGEGNIFDNRITGSDASNAIWGQSGNDRLYGGGGADTLYGGANDDIVRGDDAWDIVYGDAGNDTLNGGAGNDSVFGGTGADWLIGGVGSDLLDGSDGADILFGGLFNDMLRGGTDNDMLYGGDQNDRLYGGLGNDVLRDDNGDDVLDGGAGVDDMRGGVGNDLYYVDNTGDVVQEDANGGIDGVRTMLSSYALGATVENLAALNFTSFLGFGNALANIIEGEDGNDGLWGGVGHDTLYGNTANDALYGGDNNDLLHGGTGADHIDGGLGINTASYAGDATGVQINLSLDAATGGQAAGDTLDNIWNVIGGNGGDGLVGDGAANHLRGMAGADILLGLGGADILNGGDGYDIADYTASATGVTIKLDITEVSTADYSGLQGTGTGGDAQGDILRAIESVLGSDFVDDITLGQTAGILRGLNGSDVLRGGMGDDFVYGGNQHDRISGGNGTDFVFGGVGNDRLSGGRGNDHLTGDAGADVFVFTSELVKGDIDFVTDFEVGSDTVRLSLSQSNVLINDVVGGATLALEVSGGFQSVFFTGVTATALAGDIEYA